MLSYSQMLVRISLNNFVLLLFFVCVYFTTLALLVAISTPSFIRLLSTIVLKNSSHYSLLAMRKYWTMLIYIAILYQLGPLQVFFCLSPLFMAL